MAQTPFGARKWPASPPMIPPSGVFDVATGGYTAVIRSMVRNNSGDMVPVGTFVVFQSLNELGSKPEKKPGRPTG